MSEYIEREAAITTALDAVEIHPSQVDCLKEALSEIPAADAKPVLRWRWVEDESGVIYCPECGEEHEWIEFRANFCDNCGADMREASGEH